MGRTKENDNKNNNAHKQSIQQRNFSSLYIDNPLAIFILNKKGEIISVNKTFTKLFGFTLVEMKALLKEEEFAGKTEELRPYLQKALQGTASTVETVLIHKEGWHIPVNLTFLSEKNKETKGYVFCLCTDQRTKVKYEKQINTLLGYLQQAERNTNIGTWDYNFKENKTFFSHQTYEIFGIEDHDRFKITFDSLAAFFPKEDLRRWKTELTKAIEEKENFQLIHRIIRKDGKVRDLLQRAHVLVDNEGNITHLIGTVQDITEFRTLEKELDEMTSQFHSITDRIHAGIWSKDTVKNEILFCSLGVEDIYGISVEEFKKDPLLWFKFVHPKDRREVEASQEKLYQGQELNHQYRIIDRSGKIKWVSDQSVPIMDDQGNLSKIDGIITDITKEKAHSEEQLFMANHDYLTKLPNRRFFEKNVREFIAKSKMEGGSFAIFLFDLDRFKYINDTLGHEVGDKFLQAISGRLKMSIEDSDLLARLGGDEFIICIKEVKDEKEILRKVAYLLRQIEQPFYVEGYELFTTTSIGVSIFPDDGEEINTLIRNADRALYKAKESGKNDWQLYSNSMNTTSYRKSHLEMDLRKAIGNQEFFLEFQPKVNTKTGKIEAAEALIRWKHPEWGIVPPGEFIPLAEDTGKIIEIGAWVLKEVCTLQKRLLQKGVAVVPLCINISPKSLLKMNFIDNVKGSIQAAGIHPGLIELELTESVVIDNTEKTKEIISELRSFGVKVALDDFGTGYSSLTYLKDLEIDILKVDKSFIDGVGVNQANEGIIKSVIFLAKELGIKIVAEGVERKEQLDFLIKQNCPLIQGYIFSKPVNKERLEKILLKGKLTIQ